MMSESPTYRHFYIVGPYDAEQYSDEITSIVDKYLSQKENDAEHVTIILNDDEKPLKKILNDLMSKKYPNIKEKILSADFIKHRRKAYQKRNMRGMLMATHILVLRSEKPTLTQQYVMEEADNIMKSLLFKQVNLNKAEVQDVKEK